MFTSLQFEGVNIANAKCTYTCRKPAHTLTSDFEASYSYGPKLEHAAGDYTPRPGYSAYQPNSTVVPESAGGAYVRKPLWCMVYFLFLNKQSKSAALLWFS